jgi:hypothetical protein
MVIGEEAEGELTIASAAGSRFFDSRTAHADKDINTKTDKTNEFTLNIHIHSSTSDLNRSNSDRTRLWERPGLSFLDGCYRGSDANTRLFPESEIHILTPSNVTKMGLYNDVELNPPLFATAEVKSGCPNTASAG